jgi:hypothetical protein
MRSLGLFAALVLGVACGGEPKGTAPEGGLRFDSGQAQDAGPRPIPDGGPPPDEACGDGLDGDGDGVIDEDCFCVPGETQACFRGTAGERGVGVCGDGEQLCSNALEFGTWGDCSGDIVPAAEVCDEAGLDEDCDGAANEGCVCDPADGPVACGSDVGACTAGTQECLEGMLGECVGATEAVAERCNGVDDDCDGATDEALSRACGSDVGECGMGTQACVGGTWEACAGGRASVPEECDGLDNDCDGSTDESLARACGSDVGACSAGTQSCSAGRWSMCTGASLPAVEGCNGMDDDCDGSTDESLTRACGTGVGRCVAGLETCASGRWGTCTGGTGPIAEACDGTVDEDCDGAVDEGCGCTSGTTRPCGTDVGACMRGTQTCDSSGMWQMCMGAIGPAPEICNTLDDDCDGSADEGGVCPTSPPIVMCPGAISAEVLRTVTLAGSGSDPDGGSVTYAWTVVSRPVGSTANPSPPNAATTNFFLDASGSYRLRFCVTDDEGEIACCTVDVTSTAPGILHVEMAWDTAYGDADLHLLNVTRTPPAGWWTADDCHWRNPTPDWGPAGVAANPNLDRDDTGGFGPENITIASSPASGTYNIGVHYYCEHSIPGTTPAGPTNATVRVYCGGSLIATYSGIRLNETDDWVNVARVTYPSCAGMSVNTQTTGTALLPSTLRPPSNTTPLHCEVSCSTDANCPSGERCAEVVGPGGRRRICLLR